MSTQQYLILQLRAPLASFGGVALDNYGVTRDYPSKSMLTGLIANALGWHRQYSAGLQELQARLRFAVRVESPVDGRQWRDFQTAQIGASDKHWTTSGEPAQRAGGAKSYSGPHLRYRDYLHDLIATVALGLAEPQTAPSLSACEQALTSPKRPLFIGRKASIPSHPVFKETVTATSALQALRATEPTSNGKTASAIQCYWMPSESTEGLPESVVIRQFDLCDERDWSNNQHTGTRLMYEARVPAGWFRGLH